MIFNLKNQKGFSIIEALYAVAIFSIGILPLFIIILNASNLSTVLKNNLIAAHLAQEGLEVVRALRDENWFNGAAFDAGLADGVYRVEWNSDSLIPESGDEPKLTLNSVGLYSYDSLGSTSIFSRTVTITKDPTMPGCDCELLVVAEVKWSERSGTRSVQVESHLYDWR